MFDFHMHSHVSFDSQELPRNMVAAAEAAGLKEICFTDHIDYTADMQMVFDTGCYNAAYDHLTSDALLIRRGVEMGLTPGNQDQVRQDLQRRQFDFVIGSVHFVGEQDVYVEPYWEGKTYDQAIRLYLETVLECVKAHEDYDVLGHLTFISKGRANPRHELIRYQDHGVLFDEVFRQLIRREKGMELNTSGVDRCGGYLPTLDYFDRFRRMGGRIVTVGSDAHTADRVGQYTHEAVRALKDMFGYVCTFDGRRPIFHK